MTHARVRVLACIALAGFVFAGCEGEGKKVGEASKTETATQAGEATAKAKAGGEMVTTASGLKYEVLTPGTGKTPTISDTVTVNYRGTLMNGTEFDSSYKRGKPATFPVSGVIKGWTEALQLMKEGAKYKLVIPPDLAYGSRGAGGVIGPNETLAFEVELLKVN